MLACPVEERREVGREPDKRRGIAPFESAWPEKVAHVYDVTCVWQKHPMGAGDFERLGRRHETVWGIVPPGDGASGEVVRGLDHLDPAINRNLLALTQMQYSALGLIRREPWRELDLAGFNRHAEAAVAQRAQVRELWRVGQPYDNAADWFSDLRVDATTFKTAATVSGTLAAILRRLVPTWFLLFIGLRLASRAPSTEAALAIEVVGAAIAAVALNLRPTLSAVRMLLLEQAPDAIVGDVARAVLGALQETGQMSRSFSQTDIAIDSRRDGSIRLALRAREATAQSALFARSLTEVFGPPEAARYLIRRDDGRLPNVALRVVWAPVRAWLAARGRVRPAYHGVPSALATNRERADVFAHAWSWWVGGGTLVLGHSEEGRELRARIRRQQRRLATVALTQRWR